MHKKLDRQNKEQSEKRKVKTPTSFTQSSSSMISKAPSFQFCDAQNGYYPPIPTKAKFKYNSYNSFNNPFNNPFRFTRTPKSTDTFMGGREQGHWRKDCPKVQQHNKADLIRRSSFI